MKKKDPSIAKTPSPNPIPMPNPNPMTNPISLPIKSSVITAIPSATPTSTPTPNFATTKNKNNNVVPVYPSSSPNIQSAAFVNPKLGDIE